MKGDFSRKTFDSKKHYRAVLKQQGRVDVDADWNEQQAIHLRRIETEATDVIGGCGAPLHDAGFHTVTDAAQLTTEEQKLAGNQNPPTVPAGDFLISAGRYYVDGIQCENEQITLYSAQPDLPSPPDVSKMLRTAKATTGIVYLDVWQRHITALDDPLIREKALGGPDTTTRLKTVWQVKVLPVQTSDPTQRQPLEAKLTELIKQLELLKKSKRPNPAQLKAIESEIAALQKRIGELPSVVPTCASDFPEWDDLTAAGSGTLKAQTQPPDPTERACLLPPSAGYQRLENQLYRVEIHQGTDKNGSGTPTFVWSRDNGTVVTKINSISGNEVVVADVGPDDVLGFANNPWVEIVDDTTELNGLPGELVQISTVDDATSTITMKTNPVSVFGNLKNPKLRRWDQAGTQGDVPITYDGQPLEGGIEVSFSKGTYKTGDYWLIPARTAIGEIEWPPYEVPNTNPSALPAAGIKHHYCRLGLITVDTSGNMTISDCREVFPPLTAKSSDSAVKAFHIERINWPNDDLFSLAALFKDGLQIKFDAAPDLRSFGGLLGGGAFIVTAEVFNPTLNLYVTYVFDGEVVQVNTSDPTLVAWRVRADQQGSLKERLSTFLDSSHQLLRVRVRLAGHKIWAAGTSPLIYLDGQAFGQEGSSTDGRQRIDLTLKSGNGTRASDFESWFYLVLDNPTPTVTKSTGVVVENTGIAIAKPSASPKTTVVLAEQPTINTGAAIKSVAETVNPGAASQPLSVMEAVVKPPKGPVPGTTAMLSTFITENDPLISHDLSLSHSMTKAAFVNKYSGQKSDVKTPLSELLAVLPDQFVITSEDALLNEMARREAESIQASAGVAAIFSEAFGSPTPPSPISNLGVGKFLLLLPAAVRAALPKVGISTMVELANASPVVLSRAAAALSKQAITVTAGKLAEFAGQAKVLIQLK